MRRRDQLLGARLRIGAARCARPSSPGARGTRRSRRSPARYPPSGRLPRPHVLAKPPWSSPRVGLTGRYPPTDRGQSPNVCRDTSVTTFDRGLSPGWSPLDQPPDAGLELLLVAADLGEDGDGPLQLLHRLVAAAGPVQDVGEVVAQRRLAVAVALGGAQLERLAEQRLGRARARPRCAWSSARLLSAAIRMLGSASPLGQLEAALEVTRARSRAGRGCCWPAPRPRRRPSSSASRSASKPSVAGAVGVAAPPGDPAAVGLDDGRRRAERERLDVVALGQLPLAAALVHRAELVLDPPPAARGSPCAAAAS